MRRRAGAAVPEVVLPGPLELIGELLENDADGILAFDGGFHYIYWNPVMEAITGIGSAEALGKRAFDLFPSLEETGDDKYLRDTLSGKSFLAKDRTYSVDRRGREGAHDVFHLPLHGRDGAIVGGLGVLRCPSGRRTTEQRLRETEHRFRTMADCAPVLLWMAGTDALCDFFNQGWLDFTGRTIEQEVGFGWVEGVHPEDFQSCVDRYLASFNARTPFEMVYRLLHRDGEYRWILDRGTPRFTPDGDFAGYIGSCIDITDRKVAEDTIRRTADNLARSNLDLERFAYVASHDLQEPLRMVASFTELLAVRYRDRLDDQAREFIDYAVDGAKRMQQLIDGLLSFSRIGRGDETVFRPTDCTIVMEEVLDDLRLSARDADARITWDPLPMVMGDKIYLGQLFRNLLQNAIKFRGSEPLHIHVKSEPRDSTWLFSVTDNGMGFEMKFAGRIFEIFHRLHRRDEYPGSGIGLAVCRRIVELHGGRIWAESESGAGSTFFFTLPAEAART